MAERPDLPMTVRADGLPAAVTIYEVGPRDGLQNEKAIVPVGVKAEFVRRLVAAGLPIVEATSFVHPTWVPQLADAAELMTRLGADGVGLPVLVPNERGLDRALELGLQHVAIFGSAPAVPGDYLVTLETLVKGGLTPLDSMVFVTKEPGASTAAIVSPSTSTSALAVPVAFTTVPPVIKIVLMSDTSRWC